MRINNAVETARQEITAEELRNLVVRGMLEKKAQDVVVMDLRGVKNAITDFFVICSGNSDTQIDAIASSVEEEVYKAIHLNPWHREGKLNREWILLDYVDVVAHVFKKDRRAFYDLEQLWGDAEIQHIDEEPIASSAL
ncbi:ribosome silencing factor [Nibrella saemangeumensis]|uniref:Ribosomal silencing factor RsfS n=1 Tax=Nibrella saemangeumensis TaxID=1084526 RepID=A0ABP8N0S1_9BACT